MSLCQHAAEALWIALETWPMERVLELVREYGGRPGTMHLRAVCETEVHTVVSGKDDSLTDSLTCLHLMAKMGLDHILQEVMESQEVNLNVKTSVLGWTALHYAADQKQVETMKVLLKAGVDKNAQGKGGQCPIHLAIQRGCRKTVGCLLAKGCNVNMADKDGKTPLHYCLHKNALWTTGWSCRDRCDMVEQLLVKGANIAAANAHGDTPLHCAVRHHADPHTLNILLQSTEFSCKGVDHLNASGQTPLHVAQDPKAVQALLSFGASINQVDIHGQTPLHTQVSSPASVKLLLDHHADPLAKDKKGRNALHQAVLIDLPDLGVLQLLCTLYESVNAADLAGDTPLHLACAAPYTAVTDKMKDVYLKKLRPGKDPVIQLLVKYGARMDVQNQWKQTPFLKAIEKHQYIKATLLHNMSHGAYLEVSDEYGRTASTLAPSWYSSIMADQSVLTTSGGRTDRAVSRATMLDPLEEEDDEDDDGKDTVWTELQTELVTEVPSCKDMENSELVDLPSWTNELEDGRRLIARRKVVQEVFPDFPDWVLKAPSVSNNKFAADASVRDTTCNMSQVPKEDQPDAHPASESDIMIRPDKTQGNAAIEQLSSLQKDIDDITTFLEGFVDETPQQSVKSESNVTDEVRKLRNEINDVCDFLEEFSCETEA